MPAQTAREPPSLWPQCGRTRTLVEFAASCASPVSPNDGSDTDSQLKLFPSAISEYWMRHGQILGFCEIALPARLPASLQSVMSFLLVSSARKHSSPHEAEAQLAGLTVRTLLQGPLNLARLGSAHHDLTAGPMPRCHGMPRLSRRLDHPALSIPRRSVHATSLHF